MIVFHQCGDTQDEQGKQQGRVGHRADGSLKAGAAGADSHRLRRAQDTNRMPATSSLMLQLGRLEEMVSQYSNRLPIRSVSFGHHCAAS